MTSTFPVRGRPSSMTSILDAALHLLDAGIPVSFDSVAQQCGLTKPGLLYHFPTKSALMEALVDHIVDAQVQGMSRELDIPLESASPQQRLGAYVRWALQTRHRRSDLVMLSDPRTADRMVARWTERFQPWVEVPADLPPAERARLQAARLLADGVWLADSSATFPLDDDERPQVLAVALELLGEQS